MNEDKYEEFNTNFFFYWASFSFFRFDEAIIYFCVACEFNLRLSKQCTLPMKAMDSFLLFKTRRLCFEVRLFFDI
jgi:hypothetical protein